MPTNFRKTIPLTKAIRITVSKNGPSISIGRPGARVSVNKDGVRGSVGIPGSGVSYRKQKSFPQGSKIKKVAGIIAAIAMIIIVCYFVWGYIGA